MNLSTQKNDTTADATPLQARTGDIPTYGGSRTNHEVSFLFYPLPPRKYCSHPRNNPWRYQSHEKIAKYPITSDHILIENGEGEARREVTPHG